MQQLTGIAIYPRNPTEATLWQSESPFTNFLLGSGKSGFIVGNTSSYNCPDYTTLGDLFYTVGRIQRNVEIFDSVTLENKALAGVGGLSKTSDVEFSLINLNKDIKPFKLFGRKVVIYLCQNTYNRLDLETVKLLQPNSENSIIKYTGIITNIAPSKGVLTFTVKSNFSLLDREIGEFLETETEKYINQIIPIVYGDFSDDSAYIPVLLKTKENELPQIVVESQALYNLYNLKIYDEVYDAHIKALSTISLNPNDDKNIIDLINTEKFGLLYESVDDADTEMKIFNPYTVYCTFDNDLSTLAIKTDFFDGHGDIYIDEDGNYYEYLGWNVFSTTVVAAGNLFQKWTKINGSGPDTMICKSSKKTTEKLFDLKQYFREDAVKSETVFIKIDNEVIRLVSQIEEDTISSGSDEIYLYSTYRVVRGTSNTVRASHTACTKIYGSSEVTKENNIVFEHTFWPYAVGNLVRRTPDLPSGIVTDVYDTEIFSATNGGPTDDGLGATELAKNGLGAPVYVLTAFDTETWDITVQAQVDLMFKIPDIKGVIVDAWLQGYYEVINNSAIENSFGSISLHVGGIPAWSFPTPYKWEPSEPLGSDTVVPEILLYPSNMSIYELFMENGIGSHFIEIGYKIDEDGQTLLKDDRILVDSKIVKYVNLVGDSPDQRELISPAYVSGSLTTITEDFDKLDDIAAKVKLNTFLGGRKKYYSIKCEDQTDYPYAMGISGAEELNVFFNRRYYLQFVKYHDAFFMITNPGILVQFKTNIAEEQLYIEAKGRIDTESSLIENPVEILTDFIEKEINEKASGESLVVDSASTSNSITVKDYKSTLLLTGDRQQASVIIDSFCKENGLIVAENSEGEVTIDSLNFPESTSGLLNLTEDNFVLSNNYIDYSEKYTSVENLFTDLEVFYRKNFAVSKSSTSIKDKEESKVYADYYQDDMNENAFSILGVNKKRTFESNYFRDTTSVLTAVNLIKSYYTLPFRILTIAVNITTEIRIGQWIIWTGDSAEMLGINTSYLLVLGYDEQLPSGGEKPELRITVLEVTSELVAIIGEDIIEEMLALPNPELGEFEEVMDSPDEEEPKEIEEVK